MLRSLATLLTLLVLFAGSQPAASRARDAKLALSRKHFEAAETHYEQGRFTEALAEYRKAHSYKRFAAFIFNIAQCYRQLKQWKQSLFNYRLYLSKEPNASNRAEVLRRIREMAKQLALQTASARAYGKLTVVTKPPGAQVLLNKLQGKPDGVTPSILRLKAGSHLVAVRKKGYRTAHRQIVVTVGRMSLIEVNLQPLVEPGRLDPRRPAPRRLVPDQPPRRRDPLARPLHLRPRPLPRAHQPSPFYERWWFWTGVVLAVVTAGSGTYLGVKALRLSDEWKKAAGDVEEPKQLLREGKSARLGADIMFGTSAAIGLAVIIGAAVVGLDNPERPSRNRTRVLPSCSGQGCSITVTGRF